MAKSILPNKGEGKKEYLKRVHGIGNGGGRGRISREGHEALAKAIAAGAVFPEAVVAAKAPKAPRVSEPKVTVPQDKRAEARSIDPAAIREWAGKNGHTVSPRGRIASEVTLAYMAAVPEVMRGAREDHGKDLREAGPRVYPEGTTWRLDFEHRGEATTLVVSDRSACGNCGVSLSHHTCQSARVAVGYNDGPVRATAVYPKGFEA